MSLDIRLTESDSSKKGCLAVGEDKDILIVQEGNVILRLDHKAADKLKFQLEWLLKSAEEGT